MELKPKTYKIERKSVRNKIFQKKKIKKKYLYQNLQKIQAFTKVQLRGTLVMFLSKKMFFVYSI